MKMLEQPEAKPKIGSPEDVLAKLEWVVEQLESYQVRKIEIVSAQDIEVLRATLDAAKARALEIRHPIADRRSATLESIPDARLKPLFEQASAAFYRCSVCRRLFTRHGLGSHGHFEVWRGKAISVELPKRRGRGTRYEFFFRPPTV